MCLPHPSVPTVPPVPPAPPPADYNQQGAPQLNLQQGNNLPGSIPAFRQDLTIPMFGGGSGGNRTGLNIP